VAGGGGGGGEVKWGRKTPQKVHSSANHILGLELRLPLRCKAKGWSEGMTGHGGDQRGISGDAQNAALYLRFYQLGGLHWGNDCEIMSQVSFIRA
jgi:hypothetical protein